MGLPGSLSLVMEEGWLCGMQGALLFRVTLRCAQATSPPVQLHSQRMDLVGSRPDLAHTRSLMFSLCRAWGHSVRGCGVSQKGTFPLACQERLAMSGTPAPTGSRVIVCLLCLPSLSSCRSGPGSNSFRTGGLTRQEAPLESRAGGCEGCLPTSSPVPAGQDVDTPGSSYKKKVSKDKVRSSRSLPALPRLHHPFPLSRPHGPFCSLA